MKVRPLFVVILLYTLFYIVPLGLVYHASQLQDEQNIKVTTVFTTGFVVFPQDSNANPPMTFGGKLLSEMDRCAGITTRRFLYNSKTAKDAVTIAIDKVKFHKGAEVKDLLIVTGEVIKAKGKVVIMNVKIERELRGGTRELIMEAEFVFCAYDLEQKKGIEHGITYERKNP